MELTFECPECRMIDHTDDVESAGHAVCRHCGSSRRLPPEAFDAEGAPCACPMCAGADLYVRKDFSTAVGLAIVITGIAVALLFWYYDRPSPAYLVLGASVLLEIALYRRVPDVVVCYRCLAQLRGPGNNPGGRFRMFDFGLGERCHQERRGVAGSRGRGVAAATADPGAEAGAGST
jgi:hypothetical protein